MRDERKSYAQESADYRRGYEAAKKDASRRVMRARMGKACPDLRSIISNIECLPLIDKDEDDES